MTEARQRKCGKCNGKCTVKGSYQQGGFEVKCPTCDGKGWIRMQ